MQKPKLLFVLPKLENNSTSNYYSVYELIREASKNLDIFLFVEKSPADTSLINANKIYVQQISFPILNFIERIIIFSYAKFIGFDKAFIYYSYWSAILAGLVQITLGLKVYFWHCYWHGEKYKTYQNLPNLDVQSIKSKLFDQWPLVLSLNLCNYLVTGTKTIGELYSSSFNLPKAKIKILPNWITTDRFQGSKHSKTTARKIFQIPLSKKVVFIFPRLTLSKGADWLPEIMARIQNRVPGVLFLVVNYGNLASWFQQDIKKRGQSKSVIYVDPIPNSKVPQYFWISDLYLLASRGEGFPRPILEAMAAGTPFATFDAGGTKDLLTTFQKSYLSELGDTEGISEKSTTILKNENLYQKLVQEGLQQSQKYTLDRAAANFRRLFD